MSGNLALVFIRGNFCVLLINYLLVAINGKAYLLKPGCAINAEPNLEIEVRLNFDQVLEITEGDPDFMANLF